MSSFKHADPDSAKVTVKFCQFFMLSGSERAKADHRTLMKLTPDFIFTTDVFLPDWTTANNEGSIRLLSDRQTRNLFVQRVFFMRIRSHCFVKHYLQSS